MAADPTLADRLDAMAYAGGSLDLRLNMTYAERADLRAAAVRLRKLDAIEEAAGDPEKLMGLAMLLSDEFALHAWAGKLRRIADALGGTE